MSGPLQPGCHALAARLSRTRLYRGVLPTWAERSARHSCGGVVDARMRLTFRSMYMLKMSSRLVHGAVRCVCRLAGLGHFLETTELRSAGW